MSFEIGGEFDSSPLGPETRSRPTAGGDEFGRTSQPGPLRRVLWGLVIGLIVLGFGGGINWFYFDMLIAHQAMRAWKETPAKILKVDFREHHRTARGGSTYRATAKYEYRFEGQSYTSTNVTWLNGSDSMGPFQSRAFDELSEHRRTGRPMHCFVNPRDPTQAILYRQLRPEILVMFTALETMLGLPLAFAIFGGIVQGLGWWRRWRFRRAAAAALPAEPWRWRADWAAGQIAASDRFEKARLALFALGWNLVVAPLYVYLPAAPQGTFWPRVFGAGMVGIGWLLAWSAVRKRRGPKSVLRLDKIPATGGDRFTGQIETTARARAATPFTLALRCILLTTRRGNGNTLTREKVLWEDRKAAGTTTPARDFDAVLVPVQFSIPPDAPASAKPGDESDTRVVWRLIVDADPPTNKPIAQFDVPVFRQAGEAK